MMVQHFLAQQSLGPLQQSLGRPIVGLQKKNL